MKMNFAIPRDNDSEFLLYLWKIINLPSLSQDNLLYRISFELLLLPPKESESLIKRSIISKLLEKDEKNNITLSKVLREKLKLWQIKRKQDITKNILLEKDRRKLKESLEEGDSARFGRLLKAFSDKASLNRAIAIPDSSIELLKFNVKKGEIEAKIAGHLKDSYVIKINIDDKIVIHDCQDFKDRKSKQNKFCKHLIKLFLFLKEKNKEFAQRLIETISIDIEEWDFST